MTYIVKDNCVKCKYMDCVEVCPVDCFYEGENMLVIHPDECIDCGVCEPECPAEAISDDNVDDAQKWIDINKEYADKWPNISKMGEPPTDCKEWDGKENKFEKYFSPNPGKGG
tara:strand:- start:372 stop:710 length:339 start_codon:yes stop_codon:yes gene_type:complete